MTLFNAVYQGIDAIAIYRLLPDEPEIVNIMEDILSLTYSKFLGYKGLAFVKEYLSYIRSISTTDDIEVIKGKILGLRKAFPYNLYDYYINTFREQNLKTSLSLVSPKYFNRKVLDIGADDNRLGKCMLYLFPTITKVLGTDIMHRNNVQENVQLQFKIHKHPNKLPINNQKFDVVISRYTLHHMTEACQLNIINEVRRVLKSHGTFLVYENSFSRELKPLEPNNLPIYSKLQKLTNYKLKLLMAAMDIFSLGIKDKDQPFAFSFRELEEWQWLFEKYGFIIKNTYYYGIPEFDLHQQPLALFVLATQP